VCFIKSGNVNAKCYNEIKTFIDFIENNKTGMYFVNFIGMWEQKSAKLDTTSNLAQLKEEIFQGISTILTNNGHGHLIDTSRYPSGSPIPHIEISNKQKYEDLNGKKFLVSFDFRALQ
jgi:hypothetical protein